MVLIVDVTASATTVEASRLEFLRGVAIVSDVLRLMPLIGLVDVVFDHPAYRRLWRLARTTVRLAGIRTAFSGEDR